MALGDALLPALSARGAQLQRNGQPIVDDEARRVAALELIEATLRSLEAAALLEPAAP
jgi:hypothetical protein